MSGQFAVLDFVGQLLAAASEHPQPAVLFERDESALGEGLGNDRALDVLAAGQIVRPVPVFVPRVIASGGAEFDRHAREGRFLRFGVLGVMFDDQHRPMGRVFQVGGGVLVGENLAARAGLRAGENFRRLFDRRPLGIRRGRAGDIFPEAHRRRRCVPALWALSVLAAAFRFRVGFGAGFFRFLVRFLVTFSRDEQRISAQRENGDGGDCPFFPGRLHNAFSLWHETVLVFRLVFPISDFRFPIFPLPKPPRHIVLRLVQVRVREDVHRRAVFDQPARGT